MAAEKLEAINDPADWLDVFLKLSEFVTPKLRRMEFRIEDIDDADLLKEVQRRRAVAEAEEEGR